MKKQSKAVSLITDYMDIWTSALTSKASSGRGNGNGSGNQNAYGIKKLRELILELAVRGKLIPQDPNDEPARILVEEIAKEKSRLAKEGKIKEKVLSKIRENEQPFKLPVGWIWEFLGTIGVTNIGLTYSPKDISEDGIPVLRANNILNGKIVLSDLVRVTVDPPDRVLVNEGDLLICARSGSRALVGKAALIDQLHERTAFGAFMAIFRSSLNRYIYYFINSPLFRRVIDDVNTTTINQITQDNLRTTVIPVPPLKEQHRIVAKVDELMALCDQLEQQQNDSNTAHQALVETLLTTLTTAVNQDEFAEAWHRIAEHFDTLFTTESSIDQLKQTILQLAVMGKLVPQDPNDEPASILLKKIAAKKDHLIKEGIIKRQDHFPNIDENERPFNLPSGWEWTRLGTVSSNIHYGYTASADHRNLKIRLLRITDIQNNSVNWDAVPGCEIEEDKANDFLLEDDDILIARTGGTIGKSYLVKNISVKSVFASYLIRVRRVEGMFSAFIKTYLGTQLYWKQLYDSSMGTGQPNVNATALKGLLFPLPPLAEQHRIVAKVEELMAICDSLKARLNAAQTTQVQLSDAIVDQATEK